MPTPVINDITALLNKGFEEQGEQPEKNASDRDNLEGSPPVDTNAMLKALDPSYEPEKSEEKKDEELQEQPEVAETDEPQPEVDEQDGESETEEGLGTLTQLAEELGVDPTALYDLEVPMPNGEKSFKVGEIKNMWIDHLSKSEELETTQSELANQRQTYEQQLAQLAQFQQLPQELVQAEAAYLKAENDFNSVDWVSLESANPGQAALQRQKLEEARQLANQHRQYIAQNLQTMQGQIQAQRQQEAQKYYEQRAIQMKALIPDWTDDAKAQAGRLEVESFLAREGMPEDVYKGVLEHGHPSLVKALKTLSDHDKAAKKVSKQPPKLPKTLSTATITKSPKGKQAVLDKLLKKAKGSKDQREKVDAVSMLLRG